MATLRDLMFSAGQAGVQGGRDERQRRRQIWDRIYTQDSAFRDLQENHYLLRQREGADRGFQADVYRNNAILDHLATQGERGAEQAQLQDLYFKLGGQQDAYWQQLERSALSPYQSIQGGDLRIKDLGDERIQDIVNYHFNPDSDFLEYDNWIANLSDRATGGRLLDESNYSNIPQAANRLLQIERELLEGSRNIRGQNVPAHAAANFYQGAVQNLGSEYEQILSTLGDFDEESGRYDFSGKIDAFGKPFGAGTKYGGRARSFFSNKQRNLDYIRMLLESQAQVQQNFNMIGQPSPQSVYFGNTARIGGTGAAPDPNMQYRIPGMNPFPQLYFNPANL